jgi:hypothetical protein
MAYSDYGGYAYKNGVRVEGRSDTSIGKASGHVVLGDGPAYVALLKSDCVRMYCDDKEIDLPLSVRDYEKKRHVSFAHSGYLLEVIRTYEDNSYIYAKLKQPDGAVWHGWSGYGVGAGLEDCGYGFSTAEREEKIRALFPGAINS